MSPSWGAPPIPRRRPPTSSNSVLTFPLKVRVSQTARAAAAAAVGASSPTRARLLSASANSSPPSPATSSSAPPFFSAKGPSTSTSTCTPTAQTPAAPHTPKLFARSNSKSSATSASTLPADSASADDCGSKSGGGAPQPLPRELEVRQAQPNHRKLFVSSRSGVSSIR